jgi:hypothetical protein
MAYARIPGRWRLTTSKEAYLGEVAIFLGDNRKAARSLLVEACWDLANHTTRSEINWSLAATDVANPRDDSAN